MRNGWSEMVDWTDGLLSVKACGFCTAQWIQRKVPPGAWYFKPHIQFALDTGPARKCYKYINEKPKENLEDYYFIANWLILLFNNDTGLFKKTPGVS